jgi:hypothetical protein
VLLETGSLDIAEGLIPRCPVDNASHGCRKISLRDTSINFSAWMIWGLVLAVFFKGQWIPPQPRTEGQPDPAMIYTWPFRMTKAWALASTSSVRSTNFKARHIAARLPKAASTRCWLTICCRNRAAFAGKVSRALKFIGLNKRDARQTLNTETASFQSGLDRVRWRQHQLHDTQSFARRCRSGCYELTGHSTRDHPQRGNPPTASAWLHRLAQRSARRGGLRSIAEQNSNDAS